MALSNPTDTTISGGLATINVRSHVYDQNGNPRALTYIDGMPRINSMPYTYAIAEGMISDHTQIQG